MPKVGDPPPKTGFTCINVIDAQRGSPFAPPPRCYWCNRRLRWVHKLSHPARTRTYNAGCCCARRLCEDYDPKAAQTRAQRIAKFAEPDRWRRSKNGSGNFVQKIRSPLGDVTATVYRRDGRYKVVLANRSERWFDDRSYQFQPQAIDRAAYLMAVLFD